MADPKGAVAALRRAAELMPDPPAARLAFAESALSAGALRAVEALLFDPDRQSDPDRTYLLARLREEEGRMDEALDHARQALHARAEPGERDVELTARLARRLHRDDVELESLQLGQQTPERQVRVAELQLGAGQHAAARESLAVVPAAQLSPEDKATMDLVVSRLGALKQARQELRAVRGRPNSPEAWVRKAEAHMRAGEPNEAVAAYEEALRLHPEHADTSLALGSLLMRLNRQSEAAGIFARALARSPKHIELRAMLSEALTDPRQAEQPTLRPTQPENKLSGDLQVFRLEDLLEFLGLRRATGWLRLRSPQGQGQVRLFRGRLVEAGHPGQRPMQEELTADGRPVDHWIEQAKARSDSSLARVLLNTERVPEDVEQLCRRRLEEALEVLLSWRQGSASFDVLEAATLPPFDFSHQDLLMSIYARQDEASRDLPRVTDD